MTQDDALNILKTGANVFLTGQAGSGKTYTLTQYIKYLRKNKIGVAVTASTGIAASHMEGKAIHSWAGIGIRDKMTDDELRKLFNVERLNEQFRNTKVLIIDEISMLHSYRLDLVERVARMMKGNFEPFGGMQVILCGDFFQLPPVSRDEDSAQYFAFKSNTWKSMNIRTCYLATQHRQNDVAYLSVLNDIRNNTVTQNTINILKPRYQASLAGKAHTRLYTHNLDVDAINEFELGSINEEPHAFHMQESGDAKLVKQLKKDCLAPAELTLKKGAVVMFVKNNFDRGFVNGTLGIVRAFDESNMPIVRTRNGVDIVALPESWRYEEDGVEKDRISQIPLRLAWAITVHKSQGMSLDAAEVDLSKSFETGMGYVALSRARTLAGLSIIGVNDKAFEVDQEVLAFDKELHTLSDSEKTRVHNFSEAEWNEMHNSFLGKKVSVTAEKSYSVADIRGTHPNAYAKWNPEDDQRLVAERSTGKSVGILASLFSRQKGAIKSRLKKLGH